MDLRTQTALGLAGLLRTKKLGCIELTQACLEQIRRTEPAINALITVTEQQALEQAAQVQKQLDAGEELSPLAGVPVVLKDNICTRTAPTTCASRMLEHFTPPYDATVVTRMHRAGAVLLAKANMDELALGNASATSVFGPVKNPRDLQRIPGGSSGGSAAAVAAAQAPYALGSDTGGSIRQPSAYCGVTGIKPTYGLVSRYGLVACAPSMEQIGPIGRTAADCAAALSLLAGHDPRDATSAQNAACDFSAAFTGEVRGIRIGIPRGYFTTQLEDAVAGPVLAAGEALGAMGAVVEEFDLPLLELAAPVYHILSCAEVSSSFARYDGVKYGFRPQGAESLTDLYLRARSEGFGAEVKRRILFGTLVLSADYYDTYYRKALQARRQIQHAFDTALKRYDLILSPTTPAAAPRIGEVHADSPQRYFGDTCTIPANLTGLPAISLPCGFAANRMPVGLQLTGRAFEEPLLIRAAHAFQQKTDFHTRYLQTGGGQA